MGKCLFLRKGETHTAPISGILASDLAVGSSVYLMENGVAAEYLVVHQGLPSSMYDESCNGCWLLRKDIYTSHQWNSSNVSDYENSTIHSYLNSTFLNLFDVNIREEIKTVKIPYVNGAGGSAIASGGNGLSAKAFLLTAYEVGWTQNTMPNFEIIGSCLSYFLGFSAVDSRRISRLNGVAIDWWLRDPVKFGTQNAWCVFNNGAYTNGPCTTSKGIRPALILPSNALFDKNTLILKGVA